MKKLSLVLLSLVVAFAVTACSSTATLPSQSFDLAATGAGGTDVKGTATFAKVDDTTTTITVELTGTPATGDHPMHIHEGDITPGGGIYIALTNVNGATGMSVTTVTETRAGDPITYEELIAYDGYINVHLSADNLATVVANGEVGAE